MTKPRHTTVKKAKVALLERQALEFTRVNNEPKPPTVDDELIWWAAAATCRHGGPFFQHAVEWWCVIRDQDPRLQQLTDDDIRTALERCPDEVAHRHLDRMHPTRLPTAISIGCICHHCSSVGASSPRDT